MKTAVMELFFGPLSVKKEALLPGVLPVQGTGAGVGGGAGCSVGATAPQPPARKESRYRFFPWYFLDKEVTLVKFSCP